MSKQRKRKPATLASDAEFLAEQMAATATMMWTVAERMEYFAGFHPEMKARAFLVASQAHFLRVWSSECREQANKQKGGGK